MNQSQLFLIWVEWAVIICSFGLLMTGVLSLPNSCLRFYHHWLLQEMLFSIMHIHLIFMYSF